MDDKLKRMKRSFIRLNDRIFRCYFSYSDEREELLYGLSHAKTPEAVYEMGKDLLSYLDDGDEFYEDWQIKSTTRWLKRWKLD